MMYWNGHMTAAGWVVAIIWTLIIFALIVGAIYWLASVLSGRGGRVQARVDGAGEPSARELLDRRLARGELTLDQYRELREALSDGGPDGGSAAPPSRPAGAPG